MASQELHDATYFRDLVAEQLWIEHRPRALSSASVDGEVLFRREAFEKSRSSHFATQLFRNDVAVVKTDSGTVSDCTFRTIVGELVPFQCLAIGQPVWVHRVLVLLLGIVIFAWEEQPLQLSFVSLGIELSNFVEQNQVFRSNLLLPIFEELLKSFESIGKECKPILGRLADTNNCSKRRPGTDLIHVLAKSRREVVGLVAFTTKAIHVVSLCKQTPKIVS